MPTDNQNAVLYGTAAFQVFIDYNHIITAKFTELRALLRDELQNEDLEAKLIKQELLLLAWRDYVNMFHSDSPPQEEGALNPSLHLGRPIRRADATVHLDWVPRRLDEAIDLARDMCEQKKASKKGKPKKQDRRVFSKYHVEDLKLAVKHLWDWTELKPWMNINNDEREKIYPEEPSEEVMAEIQRKIKELYPDAVSASRPSPQPFHR